MGVDTEGAKDNLLELGTEVGLIHPATFEIKEARGGAIWE